MQDYDELMKRILAEKEGSIKGIEVQLQERGGMNNGFLDRVNLAPAAAFADSIVPNSKLSQAFNGPTPFEKNEMIKMKLADALQRQKDDYGDQALAFFKNKAAMDQNALNNDRLNEDRNFDRWYKKENLNLRSKTQGQGQAGGVKPPPHYRYTETGDLEPIPGGKAWKEIQEKENKAIKQKQQTAIQAQTVVEDIGRLLNVIEDHPGSFGPTGGRLGMFSGKFIDTPTARAKALIDSGLANIGFDQLNQMRQSSPTGGALGNVTEMQLKQLNSVLGNLDVNQPPDMLADNAKRVHNIYNDIVHGPGNGPKRYVLSFDNQGRPMTDEQMALEEKRSRQIFSGANQSAPNEKPSRLQELEMKLQKSKGN